MAAWPQCDFLEVSARYCPKVESDPSEHHVIISPAAPTHRCLPPLFCLFLFHRSEPPIRRQFINHVFVNWSVKALTVGNLDLSVQILVNLLRNWFPAEG